MKRVTALDVSVHFDVDGVPQQGPAIAPYLVHVKVADMPRRTIDVVFRGSGSKIAVFLDGCFWHGCPEHATSLKVNAAWWRRSWAGTRLETVKPRAIW